jgi:hypothetical protein
MQPTESIGTAIPGRGTSRIAFGSSQQEVRRILGKPDKAKTYPDSGELWWSYLDSGIDCGFQKKQKKQKILFALNFFREGVFGHKQANIETIEGLRPGTPRLVILQRLGKASESDDGWLDGKSNWHPSWIKYSIGIAFEFNRDGKADVMTLYQPVKQ